MAGMSNQTRHALKVIRTYLAGMNEAVQYCLEFMADQVTETSSGVLGGIQAGSVPASNVVTDPTGNVFAQNSTATGSLVHPLSLNLTTGQLTAAWTVPGSTVNVSGHVRCVETLAAPPADRFLFVIGHPGSGFYVLTTTNI